jgi:nucleotidyltransferase/DNA polymerase involved in DNA repair
MACLQDGLIAVNYAARGKGINRHMRVQQAMQKCPELQCLHVQTLGVGLYPRLIVELYPLSIV